MTEELKQEDLDDFEAAFAEFSGEEPPKDKPVYETEEPTPEHGPADPEAADADDKENTEDQVDPEGDGEVAEDSATDDKETEESDVWASVPEEAKKAYDDALNQIEKLDHAAKSGNGRVSALQKRIDELTERLTKEDDAKQKIAEQAEAAKEEELKVEFPDMLAYQKEQIKKAEERIEREVTARLQESQQEQVLHTYQSTLDTARPGWLETARSGKFQKWLGDQSEGVQSAAKQLDAGSAIKVLDAFDAYNDGIAAKAQKIAEKRKQQQTTSVETPKKGKSAKPNESDDFASAWDAAVSKLTS